MKLSNQIWLGDRTRWEENIYKVNQALDPDQNCS